MSANLRRLLLTMVSLSLVPVIWGGGWYLYGELGWWEIVKEFQYQNVLLVLIGVQTFVFYAKAFTVKQPLSNFDKKLLKKMVKKVFDKTENLLTNHDTKIEQLYQDVADLKIAFKLKPIDKTHQKEQTLEVMKQ